MTQPVSPSFWSHAWEQADLAVHAITALFFSVLEGVLPRVGDKLHAAWGHVTTLHAKLTGKRQLKAAEAKIQTLAQETLRLQDELTIQTNLLSETRIRSQTNLSAQAVKIIELEDQLVHFSLQRNEILRLQAERDALIADIGKERKISAGLQRQLAALQNSIQEQKEQYRQKQQTINVEPWNRLLASSQTLTQMMQAWPLFASPDAILQQYQDQSTDWHNALNSQIRTLDSSSPMAHILRAIVQLSEQSMQRHMQLAKLYQTNQDLEHSLLGVPL